MIYIEISLSSFLYSIYVKYKLLYFQLLIDIKISLRHLRLPR